MGFLLSKLIKIHLKSKINFKLFYLQGIYFILPHRYILFHHITKKHTDLEIKCAFTHRVR
jgi:hypothetical protein